MLIVVALALLVGPTLLVPAEGGRARETCKVWDVW